MKLPKGYLPREGDKISLIATVRFDVEPNDDYVHVRTETKYGSKDFSLDLESVEIAEFAWRVGDHALFGDDTTVLGDGEVYEIAGMFGRYAWIVRSDSSPITCLTSALHPVAAVPSVAASAPQPPPFRPLELTPDDRDPIIEGGAY